MELPLSRSSRAYRLLPGRGRGLGGAGHGQLRRGGMQERAAHQRRENETGRERAAPYRGPERIIAGDVCPRAPSE